jgi:type IV pilus assembly protein PilO
MAAAKKSALSRLGLPGKIAVGFFMLALPLAGYFTIFHSEIQAEINAAINTHQQLQAELETAKAAEVAYQRDLQELTERERNKRELMKILPAAQEAPAFLSSIQNVAHLVGVELLAWVPEEAVPEEFYAKVPMRLELSGRFHQIAKFLYNVGQLERIINMENISMSTPKKRADSDDIIVTVKVLASAFHAVQESDAPDAPGARTRRGRK